MAVSEAILIDTVPVRAGAGPARRALRRLRARKGAMLGLAIVLIMIGAAVLAPIIAPFHPVTPDWSAIRQPPSLEHLFGTDENGRDVFSRVLWGARASLMAGIISV